MSDWAEPNSWEEDVAALPQDEAAKRVGMALRLNYACQRNSLDMVYMDHILNGRWFAVPVRYGGTK